MDYRWQLTVEDSFTVTGRGTVVVGIVEGVAFPYEPAMVIPANGERFQVDSVTMDFICARGDDVRRDRFSMRLGVVARSAAEPGTIIRSIT